MLGLILADILLITKGVVSQRLQDSPQISKDLCHFTFEIGHEQFIPKGICSLAIQTYFILPCNDATKN